jgi:hypothetical protein
LVALDTKEDKLLDLATDGELPKEKIKERLIAIRGERTSIRRDIERLDAELTTSREVFLLALDLLDQPQGLYRQAGPRVRQMLNRTIFTELKIDGTEITADELAEPFDVIVPAGRAFKRRSYQRKRPPVAVSGVAFHEGVSADDLTSTDLLELALGVTGSSKTVMVVVAGVMIPARIGHDHGISPPYQGKPLFRAERPTYIATLAAPQRGEACKRRKCSGLLPGRPSTYPPPWGWGKDKEQL